MAAKIVQKNRKPFRKLKVDSVTIDIIESALRNARFEMDTVLFRTAMSPGIREQHDEFPLIANLEGKMVVGQFGSFIHGFLQGYDGTVEEGDVFLTNDPYSCNGAISHINDWLMLMPVFKDGRVIAWAAMFGHMTDVGGKVPGSLPTDARTIYEEGVSVPPIKSGSLDVILARHILWTLPEPQAALVRWRSLLRPGGRLLLVEGRWWSLGDKDYNDEARMPWAGGVRAADLAAALEPLVQRIVVVPLKNPALWGKEIADERYLLVADL